MFLRRGAIFLRTVLCSAYNIRCLCVCRLRRGLGLFLPCLLWRRALRVFRGWIHLLRRRLILDVGSLLFRRFRSRSLLRTLVLDSLYHASPGTPDTSSILLVFQRTVLLQGVGAFSLWLSSRLLLGPFFSRQDRMFRRRSERACRHSASRRLSREDP